MNANEYLNIHVKTDIRPSPIHGIGTFALRDIEIGEPIFVHWPYETQMFLINKVLFEKLPTYIKQLIFKTFDNNQNDLSKENYWFKLHNGCYWNLCEPLAFTNTGELNYNFNTISGIVTKKILAGEEVLGSYYLKNTIYN